MTPSLPCAKRACRVSRCTRRSADSAVPSDCLPARPRAHGPGHFRSSIRPERHRPSDRSQGTADASRRPSTVTNSPKRPSRALRRKPASKTNRTSAGQRIELSLPTHRSLWRFSGRTTGPLWNLTFTEVVEQIRVGGSSRSRVPTDNRDEFAGERLYPIVENWHRRPKEARRGSSDRTTGSTGGRSPVSSRRPESGDGGDSSCSLNNCVRQLR
jgi:hypothetical protein